MSVFKSACATAIAISCLSACSGSKGVSAIPTGFNAVRPAGITSADFKQIAAWGPKGKIAVAQCPEGYRVVAGGSSSSDGSPVGTGYADANLTAWYVKPDSNASAEAFATCALRGIARSEFRWSSTGPTSGVAAAQCRSGFTLVTGYPGQGTVTAAWFNSTTNTYWVAGGALAYASCVRNSAGVIIKHAWNKSQKPKTVYAGCGSGYTVIGGSMGDSAWPGPPIQEHPGASSGPGKHGYDGWWTFSNAMNELTWAACVPT